MSGQFFACRVIHLQPFDTTSTLDRLYAGRWLLIYKRQTKMRRHIPNEDFSDIFEPKHNSYEAPEAGEFPVKWLGVLIVSAIIIFLIAKHYGLYEIYMY